MGNQQPHNSTIVELIVGPFHACSNSAEIDVTLTHKQEPGGWKGVDGDGGLLRGICVAVDWVRDRSWGVRWPGDPIPPTPGISGVERARGGARGVVSLLHSKISVLQSREI